MIEAENRKQRRYQRENQHPGRADVFCPALDGGDEYDELAFAQQPGAAVDCVADARKK